MHLIYIKKDNSRHLWSDKGLKGTVVNPTWDSNTDKGLKGTVVNQTWDSNTDKGFKGTVVNQTWDSITEKVLKGIPLWIRHETLLQTRFQGYRCESDMSKGHLKFAFTVPWRKITFFKTCWTATYTIYISWNYYLRLCQPGTDLAILLYTSTNRETR